MTIENPTEVEVTDARGRKIKLKRPNLLAHVTLTKAAGAQAAGNRAYMTMLFPLLYVGSTDGVLERVPRNEMDIDSMLERLDNEGMAAVVDGILRHFNVTTSETIARPL
jgi:hypothetical protein